MSGSSRRGIGAAGLLLDGFAGCLRSERGVTELTVMSAWVIYAGSSSIEGEATSAS